MLTILAKTLPDAKEMIHWTVLLTPLLLRQGTHSGIQRIGLALFGLLAGLSLLDMVMVFVLSQQVLGQAGLLQFYSPASLPLLSVYVVLFLVVFISVLDRYVSAHASAMRRTCTLHVHSASHTAMYEWTYEV